MSYLLFPLVVYIPVGKMCIRDRYITVGGRKRFYFFKENSQFTGSWVSDTLYRKETGGNGSDKRRFIVTAQSGLRIYCADHA